MGIGVGNGRWAPFSDILPERPMGGHIGYYPVCNGEEWSNLPDLYKAMEWNPVPDIRDGKKEKAVKAVIFDVVYMEPYGISAKVHVHPQEVQKILFCLHENPQCQLFSVSGIELEGGTKMAAKWLQDSRTGAFAIVAGGLGVGIQGGYRGFVPEGIQKTEAGRYVYNHSWERTKVVHFEVGNPFRDEECLRAQSAAQEDVGLVERLDDAAARVASGGGTGKGKESEKVF